MVFLPNQIIFFLPTGKHNIFFLPEQKQTTFFLRCHRQTFFFQDVFKEPFNCETGMRGTVTCKLTVADDYRLTALMSATKLITRYYSNETLTQCFFSVCDAGLTLNQHWRTVQCLRKAVLSIHIIGAAVSQSPQ